MTAYAVIVCMKAISIRLDSKLGTAFDAACKAAGYKKNTLLARLIAAFVQHQRAHAGTKTSAKRADPFAAVIGTLRIGSLTDDIDDVVYSL